ncbi:MAG: sugar phosphate nucleotidyltransferase, partial [Ahrensia sp.]
MKNTVSNTYSVIMCGGSGARLWPASRPSRPKQFVPLVGETTLFEQTVTRVCGIADIGELIVVAGERHAGWINAQTGCATVPTKMLLEPMARDSAPAIAAAVAYVEAIDPQGVLIIVASDHFIPSAAQFHADVNLAVQSARAGGIVTLGIMPTEPSPAYGYIQPGFDQGSVGPLSAFFEKPDTETAARYIEEGFLWNSGNFIARADTLARAFEATSPDVLACARDALKHSRAVQGGLVLGEPFKQAPKVSFDYAVMEKYDDLKVVRSSVEWSDLGAWDAVHTTMAHDARGNAHIGDALLIDADNCHIRATTDQPVVVAGVEGLNIIVEPDVVLVTALNRSQGVKQIVDILKDQRQYLVDVPGGAVDLAATAKRWRQWLDTIVLPLWWSHGFDHTNGLFRECLSHDSARPTEAPVRARVQGRQAFVYARAGASGWPGPWRDAVKAGLNAAQKHYAGTDGLMYDRVSADCANASDAVRLYDQTFTLLALCHGRDIIDNAEAKALAQLNAIEARFGRSDGGLGFCEAPPDCYQANAHMHLFEVAIDWAASGGDPRWTAL